MRPLPLALAAFALATPAAAQQGTCTTAVLQFEGTSDKGWLEANQQKTFTYQRRSDTLALEYATPGAEPGRTDMVIVGESPLTITAAMTSVVGLEVFAWESGPAQRGEPYEATYSVISGSFVNTWVLNCGQ